MKKYLFKISAVLVALVAFTACEDENVTYDSVNGKALAAFAKPTGGLPVLEEGISSAEVIVNVSTVSTVDRVISVEIDEDETTATAAMYTIDATTFKVPAGSHYGKIKVTGDFSALDSNEYYLVLKLTGVDGAILEDDDAAYNTFRLKIFKTCPFDANSIGTSFTGSAYMDDFQPSNYIADFTPVVTTTSDPRVLSFDTLWGNSFVATVTGNPAYDGQYVYKGTIKINEDLTLTITGADSWATGGDGFYDPCTNVFTYVLAQELFTGNAFVVPVVLIPN